MTRRARGAGSAALDYAIAHIEERQQFGKALAEFHGVQFMLAVMAMKLEAARQLVCGAAAKSERDDADLPLSDSTRSMGTPRAANQATARRSTATAVAAVSSSWISA